MCFLLWPLDGTLVCSTQLYILKRLEEPESCDSVCAQHGVLQNASPESDSIGIVFPVLSQTLRCKQVPRP